TRPRDTLLQIAAGRTARYRHRYSGSAHRRHHPPDFCPVADGWHRKPESKHQVPSSKYQINPKFQAPNRGPRFELGTWSFSGVWSLGLGASLEFGVWCLEL